MKENELNKMREIGKLSSWNELNKRIDTENNKIKIEKDFVILYPGQIDYVIRKTRLKNSVDVLRWAMHLVTKSWMEPFTMYMFINKVCEDIGIDL